MDNNDQWTAVAGFNAAFEARLAELANSWGVSAKTDSRIKNIRYAAEIGFLFDAQMNLNRLKVGAPYSTHRAFFQKLSAPEFQPMMYGTEIAEDSAEYSQAISLLKNFAHYIGTCVEGAYKSTWSVANAPQTTEFRHFAHS